MMNFSVLTSLLSLIMLSCHNVDQKISSLTSDPCGCEKTIGYDSLFVAGNVRAEAEAEKISLSFNCVDIETAIASVSVPKGNEVCINLYEVKCTSKVARKINLSEKFSYSEEGSIAKLTADESRNLFFKQIADSDKNYFEFFLNEKKEVVFIYKLKVD